MIGIICFIIVLTIYFFSVFMSENALDNGFMFSLIVLLLVIIMQSDFYTKVLKLERQNLKNERLPDN